MAPKKNEKTAVLLISNEMDATTGDVMDCLFFKYDIQCIRLNELSLESPSHIKIEISNQKGVCITVDGNEIYFIWIRKFPEVIVPSSCYAQLESFYKREYNAILSFFDLICQSGKFGLGSVSYNPVDVNKLFALKIATEVGLQIPNSIIINRKKDYCDFLEENGFNCITKPIQSITTIYDTDSGLISKMLTARVSIDDDLEQAFFPSFIQQEIEKEYELRVFYICGQIHTVAIFSQLNPLTRTDFRNYDSVKPNRLMKYQLPAQIKNKIKRFMNRMNLSTGSIDLIRSKTGEFIFLEVNPYGLLGHFSDVGFDLNRIIAWNINQKTEAHGKA